MASINRYTKAENPKKLRRSIFNYFQIAAKIAASQHRKKTFYLASVGIRSDGAMVTSANSLTKEPAPSQHAEARLCRKLSAGSIVYLVRVARNGDLAISKPCQACERLMRNKKVKKVYYSISANEYGVLEF